MTSHDSSETLTALVPERHDDDIFDRVRVSEWVSSGSPGIEDVRGDVLERVVVSDVPAAVTAVGFKRGGGR